jgi:2-dehydropantoate 2-reductase
MLAWQLAASGTQVTLAVRRETQAGALSRGGLTLFDAQANKVGVQRSSVVTAKDLVPVHEVVFVATKAYDVRAAVRDFRALIGPTTVVVSLQNGIGSTADIEAALAEGGGSALIARAVTNNGATRLSDTAVRIGGRGQTYLGAAPGQHGGQTAARRAAAALLCQAGWQTEQVDDIEPFLWGKLLVNAGINPVTALLGAPNCVLLENEAAATAMELVVSEAVGVIAQLGIVIPWDEPMAEVRRVIRATGANRSSMLQDLEAGRRTEIDYINGAVISYGRRVGVSSTANRVLLALVKARERQVHSENN